MKNSVVKREGKMHFKNLRFLSFCFVCFLNVCMYVCACSCVCHVPAELSEKSVSSLGTGLMGSCETTMWVLGPKQVLTVEPSLQVSQTISIKKEKTKQKTKKHLNKAALEKKCR